MTTLDAVPYSGGHWIRELTTFYSSTRQYISLNQQILELECARTHEHPRRLP